MTPGLIFLILRGGLALTLYAFLVGLAWLLRQSVQIAAHEQAARARPLGRLVVLDSRLPAVPPGTVFPLLPVTGLGRAPTNTAALPDETASLEHALLHLREGQWWLEDLNSRNGTRLNQAVISGPAPVMAGDVIGVGRVELKMELQTEDRLSLAAGTDEQPV